MLSVKIKFDESVLKDISKAVGRMNDFTPITERASVFLLQDTFRHFKDEEGQSGSWTPLKPATKKYKEKHGWTKTLQNTGRLRQSNAPSYDKRYAVVENQLGYANVHQFGNVKRNIPQREFLWLSQKNIEKIGRMALDYILGKN